MTRMNERLFGVLEAAEELHIKGEDLLLLIRSGELDAGKGRDGHVYVPESALRDFEQRRNPPPFDPDPSLIGDMEKGEKPPTDKR